MRNPKLMRKRANVSMLESNQIMRPWGNTVHVSLVFFLSFPGG